MRSRFICFAFLFLGENKNETKKWFQTLGQRVPSGGNKFGFIRSITLSFEDVKAERKSIDIDSFANDDKTIKELKLLEEHVDQLLDLIRKALEKIEEFLSAGDPNSSVRLAAEAKDRNKKIKADTIKIPRSQRAKEHISSTAFTARVSQIIPFVKGKDLLRYLPDEMLDIEQRKLKREGIAETVQKNQ